MRANPDVRQVMADEIESELDYFYHHITMILAHLRCASTVEEIMDCKKDILTFWISRIPLSYDTCYFCIENSIRDKDGVWEDEEKKVNCDACLYAVRHGRCSHEDSTYDKIRLDLNRLKSSLATYNYRDEVYELED